MDDVSGPSDETLVGDETDGHSRPKSRRPSLIRGDSIGRYVVIERIGVGGMGVVHAAYDPELDRAVALKVLVPREGEPNEERASRRLLREAQAMARLSHPNVVTVHDVGLHQGRVFVAMELIEGTTLTRWLEQSSRSVREILSTFVLAGRGLQAAHEKGLVHRDFKPDNVMVGHDSGAPRVQVMDFGLARTEGSVDLSPSADSLELTSQPLTNDVTRVGQVLGTPRFMAPEQHLRGEVDARTDQFAFCVALWMALLGDHPFGGDTAAELTARVVTGEVHEPSATPQVGTRLRRALRRGLAVYREDRWPSMDALLVELEHDPSRIRRRVGAVVAVVAVAGGLVGVQRIQHANAIEDCERAGAEIDRVWGDAARLRVRAGMLASGLDHALGSYERLTPWLDRAAQRWSSARTEACMATEIEERWDAGRGAIASSCLEGQGRAIETLLEVLSEADRNAVHDAVLLAADLPPADLCIDERYLAYQPEIPADLELRATQEHVDAALWRAQSLMSARRYEEGREVLDSIRPELETLGPGPARVRGLALDAWLDKAEVRFDAAAAGYREAFLLALRLGAVHLGRDIALDLAALVGGLQEDYPEALLWLDLAEALSGRIDERDRGPAALRILDMRAIFELHRGDPEAAFEFAEQALALGEEVLGPDHPRTATEVETLANVLRDLGRYDRALALARRSLEMREASLGSIHPKVLLSLESVAEILRQRGEIEEALAARQRVAEVAELVFPPGDPRIASSLANLGLSLHSLGRSREALPLFDRGIAILSAAHGPDHADLAAILINRGNAQQTLGELDDARETYEHALRIIEATLGVEHPNRGIVLLNLGNTEAMATHLEQALVYLHQALAVFEGMGVEHPNVAAALTNIASVEIDLGRTDDAIVALERALAITEKVHGPMHPDVAYALIGVASAEFGAQRPERALVAAERALAIRESRTVSPLELAVARWYVAQALRATRGDDARAVRLARQALPIFEDLERQSTVARIEAFLEAAPLETP